MTSGAAPQEVVSRYPERMWVRASLLFVLLAAGTAVGAPNPEEAARRAIEAHEKGDAKALETLARDERIDPFLLVEGLYERGQDGAATAFAQATRRPQLVSYAGWRATNPPRPEVVEALVAVAKPGADRAAWLKAHGSLASEKAEGVRYLRFLGRVGQSHHLLGAFETAIPFYERAANGAKALGWTESAVRMLGFASNAAREGGRGDEHERLILDRVAVARAGTSRVLEFNVLRQARHEFMRVGRMQQARAHAQAAIKVAVMPVQRLVAWQDLGLLEIELGEMHAAVRSLETWREQAVAAERPREVARADLQLAVAEARIGRFARVLPRVARAVAWFEANAKARDRYRAHISAGKAHLLMRDTARTLHHVTEARKAIGGARGLQDVSLEASAYSYLGRIKEAIPLFKATLAADAKMRPEHRAAAIINLANLLAFAKRADEAEPYLKEAQGLLTRIADPSLHAHVHACASLLFAESGRFDEAIAEATKARGIHAELLERELGAANEIMLARCWLAKGDVTQAKTHASAALELVLARSAALPARLGAQYRSALRGAFQYAVEAAVRADSVVDAFAFAEQAAAVALRRRLGAQEVVLHALPATLRERELELQESEARAMRAFRAAARGRDAKARRAALVGLGDVREQLDRHRERVRAEQVAASQVIDPTVDALAAVQKRLAKDEVLLMFAEGLDHVHVLMVQPSGARTIRLDTTNALHGLLDQLVLESATTDAASAVAELRARIASPLALSEGVKRIVIVPTGRLVHLPFSAIWPEHAIRLASSATIDRLLAAREPARGEGVLAIADPESVSGRSLPGARAEAKAVGDVVLLGADATEAGLAKALAQRERWRAVHVACHGLIDPGNPLRSALALTPSGSGDGHWTVSEILQSRVKADLVVLGACSTGRGKTFDQEGALGFVQAFFIAGARRVLVSLWDVDDAATSALLTRFHAEWKAGHAPARALARAQAWVRNQPRWKHPAYWAAWQLWGPE